MTSVNALALGIDSFGDEDTPLVLLAGGTTMLSWPDALCERLAGGGRRVVRYDLRDSGESTTADPEGPATACATSPPTRRPLPTCSVAGRFSLAPANVVANSFGASIALGLDARRPDLFRTVCAHEPPLMSLAADDPVVAQVGEAIAPCSS